jgi:hypothetical protein
MVRRELDCTRIGRVGSDQGYATASASNHRPGEQVTECQRSCTVGRDTRQLRSESHVEKTAGRGHRGVVDEEADVDVRNCRGHLVDHVGVGQVSREGPDLDVMGIFHRRGCILQRCGTAGQHQDVQTSRRSFVGERRPDAHGSSRDERPRAVLLRKRRHSKSLYDLVVSAPWHSRRTCVRTLV